MITLDNEFVVAFDVDETLVMWEMDISKQAEGRIAFLDPYDGTTNYLTPHKPHIALLKKYKGRGMCVIVWSAGGTQWAKSVVNTLGLADYVDLILTKPSKYVDDLLAHEVLGNRIYLKEKE